MANTRKGMIVLRRGHTVARAGDRLCTEQMKHKAITYAIQADAGAVVGER